MVIAVAHEGREAEQAPPWIVQARPSYPCLIDENHLASALHGMVDVPECVSIDERGTVVRPPDTAGSTDHFRRMDPVTRTLGPYLLAERNAARKACLEAADALLRLALHLRRQGSEAEAAEHFAEASRLHPDSWCIFRDAQTLEHSGIAGGTAFWERVQALGDKPHRMPPQL